MEKSAFVLFVACVALISAIVVGWVLNIIELSGMDWNNLGVEAVLRILGIVLVPIGVVMGYFV